MKLYRSKDGSRYHLQSCCYAKPELEWKWARDQSERTVWDSWQFGVYACGTCKPLGGKGVRP